MADLIQTCRLLGSHIDAAARQSVPFAEPIIERARAYQREDDFAYRD